MVTADVVVVGAGVIGCSVALELARAGRDVVVVDKAAGAGQGSTSASSAIVRFNYSTFDGVATAWESLHCWAGWAAHLGTEPGPGLAALHRVGAAMLDVPAMTVDRTGALFDAVGVPFEVWDAATLRDRVPGLEPGRHWPPKRLDDPAFWQDHTEELGAVYMPDAGYVDDPMLAARNLADAAARHGVRFLFRERVVEVPRTGGRAAGVVLAGGTRIAAPVVVNVAGPWSAGLNALAGVGADFTVAVRPMRQEVHQVPAPPGYTRGPVVGDLDLGVYVRPTPGGAVLIGGTEPECDPLQWVDDPDTVNLNRTKELFEAQVTRAARRFPGLGVPATPKGIAGVYDVAADWTPVYDRTDLDGFYVAMGTSGNQFKNAPVAGQLMSTLIQAVEKGHDHDADPVRFHCPHTGHTVNLGTFSRRRTTNENSTGTVMG
ncbi:NAD(P)/FAD-dependent oxidoreductase [Amycolatopsis suaedae]|uniref:FAD-binding oxidoreductase n=1 Tax=Amycolatopsis suaedae TaxID=2510978 RepID=A0A4Q7JF48_9PSEU|nr:FAD-dependent oxidoreductase [Amycolatopsis suaedae]RZQ65968.1 FAD-binding oxidoreductase [Amycolatopsis suaedae]